MTRLRLRRTFWMGAAAIVAAAALVALAAVLGGGSETADKLAWSAVLAFSPGSSRRRDFSSSR